MRTVPILATGIALVLAFGAATAVATTSEPSVDAGDAVDVVVVEHGSAPEVTTAPVVVTVAERSEPTLERPVPTVASAPASAPAGGMDEVGPAPVVEAGDGGPHQDTAPHEDGGPIWTGHPAYVDAACTDVVPQSVTDAMWADRGLTRYGIHFPIDWYFPWQGYPVDELQVMAQHWLANCTWSGSAGSDVATMHADFAAGLDAADLAVLQQQSAAWDAITLSTGDVLRVDRSRSGDQYPATRAYLLQDDRWIRIWVGRGVDPAELAETLLASGLTWP